MSTIATEQNAVQRGLPSAKRQATPLPIYVRYQDLVDAGILSSWTQLARLLKHEGFPEGVMLSANVRAWRLDEINAWLATRPAARKVMSEKARRPRKTQRA